MPRLMLLKALVRAKYELTLASLHKSSLSTIIFLAYFAVMVISGSLFAKNMATSPMDSLLSPHFVAQIIKQFVRLIVRST